MSSLYPVEKRLDTLVKWNESSLNRCGLYVKNTRAEKNIWFDDTEIWGP